MTPFQQALAHLLAIEGAGYKTVGGHPTYCGIDRRWWPTWSGWAIVDECEAGDLSEEIRDEILVDYVAQFYRLNFWDRFQGDKVAALSLQVATEIFEAGVNIGVRQAVKFFQTALNMQNNEERTYPDISVDGTLGAMSLSTLKRYLTYQSGTKLDNETILLNCMNGEQYIYYKNNPRHEQFRGWFRRV